MIDDQIEFFFMKLLLPMIVIGIIGMIIALPFLIYAEYKAEKIYLIKADWECTNTKTYTTLQPFFNGKTTILIPQIHTECVEYKRK